MTTPHRLLRTPLGRLGIGALSLLALGGAFAAGQAWPEQAATSGRLLAAPHRDPIPPDEGSGLSPAGSCDQLLDHYVDHSLDQVTPWGWDHGPWYGVRRDLGMLDGVTELKAADSARASGPASPQSVTSSPTGTNVQEAGVDEPDVVKTNGTLLVRLDGDDLTTYDVSGARVRELSRLDLPGRPRGDSELLLVGNEVVVLSPGGVLPADDSPATLVRRVDLSDPAEPELLDEQEYSATLLSARAHGTTIRLVLGTGLPALDFVQPGGRFGEQQALRANREVVRRSSIEDWLLSVRDDGGEPGQLAGCEAMHLPEDFSGAGSVSVVGYDVSSPSSRDVVGVAAQTSTAYSATDRLYLATWAGWGGWGGGWDGWPVPDLWDRPCCPGIGGPVAELGDGVSDLHAFALSGTDASYVGSGEVEGAVADRWSMDSADGVLRVAVGPTAETGNFNSVVTFAEEDGRLVERGRVDRLGVDEDIKSVRWFDDLAIVVTFRQIDPLYAIDLTDPLRPRLLGELKIPGFSEYLHPIGDDQLLGLGTDADRRGRSRGGQAAVFDISDLSAPERVSQLGYGRTRTALAAQDPRQFTWLADRRTALTVVSSWGGRGGGTGWVSVLEVGPAGGLSNTMVRAAYGSGDIGSVRTLPLPDGRVVLSAEGDARFLTW
ncbi:beta-propeller domain-containing protein [Nocardioides donggukensis]|uniref:Beta-propeller domain-containing protein n=1 Tax=Nocardioides donggukensis TaxID=2774019 RepID=A0A927Q3L3_9ACTN|nr:beta-propeller domain-containing protein [Nocardioides donggukensis]MBD8870706.1 beta-propeller domain-containing protein [Nocardioides donggukensis]